MLGFWSWVLIVIVLAAIFGAGRMPELQKYLETKFKQGMDVMQKGKKDLENKMSKTKKDDENKNN